MKAIDKAKAWWDERDEIDKTIIIGGALILEYGFACTLGGYMQGRETGRMKGRVEGANYMIDWFVDNVFNVYDMPETLKKDAENGKLKFLKFR